MPNTLVFEPCYPFAHEVTVAEKEEVHIEKDAANRRSPSSIDTRGS